VKHRGTGSIYRRGAVYWVAYYRNGKLYRESSHSEKEQEARKLLKRRQGEISLGRFIGPDAEKVTVRELAADYLNDYSVNQRKSLDKAERLIKRFNEDGKEIDSEFMAFFGDFKAHSVTTDLVKRYIAQRKEKDAANGTLNRELSGLKRMFNLGIQAEKIYRRPHIPLLTESPPRQGFFEYGEFVAFRNALPDYFKPVVTFAYYTGWRKQEILKLRWNQIDLNARTVRLEAGTTKNGKGRVLKLNGELLETIGAQWERRKVAEIPGESPTLLCPYVFHREGKPIRDFRKAWDKARTKTGLTTKTLHDFRRTAVRDMVRDGTPETVAMMISDHQTRSGFDCYDITSENDLEDAARKMSIRAESLERTTNVVAFKRN